MKPINVTDTQSFIEGQRNTANYIREVAQAIEKAVDHSVTSRALKEIIKICDKVDPPAKQSFEVEGPLPG